MTGHGQATMHYGEIAIDVEIRTVNNRFLKVVSKISEVASSLEPHIESIVREYLKRGSVSVSIRVSQSARSNAAVINQKSLEDYVAQAKLVSEKLGIPLSYEFGAMLQLPGVLDSLRSDNDEHLIEIIRSAVQAALLDLQSMRRREGAAMTAQFQMAIDQVQVLRASIAERAPSVVTEYRSKMEQRVRSALSGHGHQVSEVDLLREILVYADRCDISEEITRLDSHLKQFRDALGHAESQGRRLDFLIQELFRETNTIGSKANDATISQWVVSIKTIIEQMRELVQNVE